MRCVQNSQRVWSGIGDEKRQPGSYRCGQKKNTLAMREASLRRQAMKDQADEKNQPVSESQWVTMLDQYVTRNQPQLKDEYGSEYDHFLTEMTNDSMDMLVEIIQEGMDPTEARQVVIAGMLEEIDSAYPQSNETIPPETGDTPTEDSSEED
jgi:hypothetical protein